VWFNLACIVQTKTYAFPAPTENLEPRLCTHVGGITCLQIKTKLTLLQDYANKIRCGDLSTYRTDLTSPPTQPA
jgi:hypothetical protein